ncbi:MAG TPA: hypothetical protein VEY08_13595, partial [Chloroflexia bacterium]|nr:hypothetical protein [Chloroflexia bacterium]
MKFPSLVRECYSVPVAQPSPAFVVLSVAKNLVLQHLNTTFPFVDGGYGAIEKGNIPVADEILRYAQNDKGGR